MLKTTVLSLLVGAVALVAVLTQCFAPPGSGKGALPSITLSQDTAHFGSAWGTLTGDGVELKITDFGLGVISLETGGIDAADYPYLHLAIENAPHNLITTVAIKAVGKEKGAAYRLEHRSPESVWLSMNEFEGWQGDIEAIRVTFHARAGANMLVTDLSLHPASASRQMRAIFTDLVSFAPWKRAQMNTHTGVAKVASFYPVPLVMTLLLLSLAAYGLVLLLTRRRFSWTGAGLIFLVCWVVLDLVWQKRLTHQVAHSYNAYAGKTTAQKIAAGPDARLFKFISQVKEHIDSPESRIFVASSDLYLGMRGAYYLYPLNAYWKLERPEIPANDFMRAGDYVLRIHPSRVYYRKGKGVRRPETKFFPADLVFASTAGKLYRLK